MARERPRAGPFTVDYATVDGTAVAGQDYVAANGTLAFAAGDLSRTFEVPIINDGILESDQSFQVALSNPSGGASLGAVTNLTATLCDATGMRPHGFAAIHRKAEGVVKLAFTGGVSQRFQPFFDLYPVEVSTNLVDWQALALLQRTNSATNELTFIDPAGGTPARFYRVPTDHCTAAYLKPTGPYPVGRIDRLVTDPTRRNRYCISTNGSFAISIWYPAAPTAGQRPARWFEEVMARDTSSASYWAYFGVTTWLDRLPYLWTYSCSDAPLVEVSGTFPIVLFSPGATANRRHGTELVEGLASHGYVAMAVDHYDAYDIAWPDGFYLSGRTDDNYGLKDRVRDLVVVLDELTNWNQNDARFAGRLCLDKVSAMGMSWGGPTVAELAQQDARCKAVVLLDPGGTAGSVQGFSRPSLTMHRPGDSDQSVFAASKINAVWFQISNTDHASFANYVIYHGSTFWSDHSKSLMCRFLQRENASIAAYGSLFAIENRSMLLEQYPAFFAHDNVRTRFDLILDRRDSDVNVAVWKRLSGDTPDFCPGLTSILSFHLLVSGRRNVGNDRQP